MLLLIYVVFEVLRTYVYHLVYSSYNILIYYSY